jgi:hypothetical protein
MTEVSVKCGEVGAVEFGSLRKGDYFMQQQRILIKVTEVELEGFGHFGYPFKWNAIQLTGDRLGKRSTFSNSSIILPIKKIELKVQI